MEKQMIPTSLAPDCFVGEVFGDLRVMGWEHPKIAVYANPEELDLREEDGAIRVSCKGDLELRVPYAAALTIDNIHGDAQIKLLDERLKLDVVHGSLNLSNVAGATVAQVYGDISAKMNAGDIEVQQALGDASIQQIQGSCVLTDLRGKLRLQNVSGSLHVESGGDARIRLGKLAGDHYTVKAGGDIQCILPSDSSFKLGLVSGQQSITIHLPESQQTFHQKRLDMDIGEGGNAFMMDAKGEIFIAAGTPGWESSTMGWTDYGEEIARQVEEQIGKHMEELTRRTKEQMDRLIEILTKSGMKPEEIRRVMDQTMRDSEREAARAQEKMRRAQEKMERKLQEAQQKIDQKARAAERRLWARSRHSWDRGYLPSNPSAPPLSHVPTEPVTDEERLMILQMLEQKKISLKEAEKLLSTLEGVE